MLAAAFAAVLSPPAAADAARGLALYTQICASCHATAQSTGGLAIRAGAGNPEAIRNALQIIAAMQFLRPILTDTDIADLAEHLAIRFGVSPPPPPTIVAVEFHHAGFDHYFVSAIPAEIAALDAGTAIRGWSRTGETFNVWPGIAAAPSGASPVCRFYLPPEDGDSHFYSASPAECGDVRMKFPRFVHEAAEVMAARLPDLATGACAAGTIAVYRLWNARVDTNHRYTTKRELRTMMIGNGHVPEGYGPEGVAFCAPV